MYFIFSIQQMSQIVDAGRNRDRETASERERERKKEKKTITKQLGNSTRCFLFIISTKI